MNDTTEHEDWRLEGGKVIGRGLGWEAVRLMGDLSSAARAVADHQGAVALRAEVDLLARQVSALAEDRDGWMRVADRMEAERDAARAELDAASKDGLGLPQVGPVRWSSHGWLDSDGVRVADPAPASHLRLDAAWALAVAKAATAEERARLADEATTDDKDETRG